MDSLTIRLIMFILSKNIRLHTKTKISVGVILLPTMLQSINIPQDIKRLSHSPSAENLIDQANDRIEALMLADDSITDSFIPCDFHLLDQSLTWMEQNQLLNGRRFCELGSGLGVAALLASLHGLESVGIEIDSALVDQANKFAKELNSTAKFYSGSFVPHGVSELLELARKVEQAENNEGDVYEEIGMGFEDFDLFFVFPWPGDQKFYEALFQAKAASNALLLSYHGRNGMQLVRKADS